VSEVARRGGSVDFVSPGGTTATTIGAGVLVLTAAGTVTMGTVVIACNAGATGAAGAAPTIIMDGAGTGWYCTAGCITFTYIWLHMVWFIC